MNALVFAGSAEEAIIAADGLVEAAEATGNPWAISYALLSDRLGVSRRRSLDVALEAARRGLVMTRDSGNRFNESHMATVLAALEIEYGDPLGCTGLHHARDPQLSGCRKRRLPPFAPGPPRSDSRPARTLRPAAVVASFAALSPMAVASSPQIAATIESYPGESWRHRPTKHSSRGRCHDDPRAMVAYAYEQIDQARAELEQLR